MTQMDRQIESVRGRLAMGRFLSLIGFSLAGFCGAVLLFVLIDRVFWIDLPHTRVGFFSLLGATVLFTGIYAVLRRPSPHQAAVLIDRKLNLNEKFSTALYARLQSDQDDPFVAAALLDAEHSAENVSLRRQFPFAFPRSGFYAIGSAVVLLSIVQFLPRMDLFGQHAARAVARQQLADRVAAQQAAQQALAAVNALPKAVQNQQKVELAKKDLQLALEQNQSDPTVMKLTAQKAQQEAEAAKRDAMNSNPRAAQAAADKAVFNALSTSSDDAGPVADASRDISNADFAKAADALQSLPEKFDQMTPDQQQQAISQMQNTADQLKKIADDPAAMQNAQQQLKQAGATTQQSQDMAQAAQQAAQQPPGKDSQAQQKLQQMQKQIAQQTNPQKPPTTQQVAQLQKTTQQMQSIANSQAAARQLARSAQQMVHGMQQAQAKQQGGSQGGQQQANAKAGNPDKPGPLSGGQSPSGQQGGTQQANASKVGGQAPGGDQPGQAPGSSPGSAPGQSEMQQAAGQMAQSMNQMDQTQNGGQQMASGQQPGSQPGNNPGNGNSGQSQNHGAGKSSGQSGGNGAGSTGTAPPLGSGPQHPSTPFTLKQEIDPSQNVPGGRILAKSYVKADPIIGKSTIQLSPQAKAVIRQSTDDVSEDTVPRDAQKAVKDYFDTVQNSNGK